MSRIARLGAFIVATLAILAAGVFVIGSKEYLFRSTYHLKAQFDNVAGLAAGADVQVGGVHSGTVQSIALPHKPGEQVTVLMDLDKSTHEIIKQDSVASIETEGVLGNQFVAISFGSAGQAEVKDGETIQSEPPLEISDLFKKTSGILDSSLLAINNATLATAHLNSVSAKIDSGQGTVGALVNDKQLYSNLEQTTSTLHTTMQQAQVGVTDFQENMEAMKHNFFLNGYFKKRGYEDSADLAANRIGGLPQVAPLKVFTYTAKQLFDAHDSAKLKDRKPLNAGGEFLAQNQFGFAVIVASTGMEGDTKKDQVLTEARAMVVREYLVENFGFDDSQLKTLGLGKQPGASQDADWGSIQILVFPTGTEIPADKLPPVSSSSIPVVDRPVQVTTAATHQP
ncbi:MAG TPA: MlaD family protein [Terracidiphilus sp.]|jgi:phospholipid/cholesterol/gamma-HCH transport system substrate-binding protein